jgi:hypothetical protein
MPCVGCDLAKSERVSDGTTNGRDSEEWSNPTR